MDIPGGKIGVPAQSIIVIAGYVIYFGAVGRHPQNTLDNRHVLFGEIPPPELPDVNKVPVQNQGIRGNGLQVQQQFLGMTTVGAQVYIRNYCNIQLSFHRQVRTKR